MVISFGDAKEGRLGNNSTGFTLPKACYTTKNIAPKRILSAHLLSAIIDEDDRIFTCGLVKNVTNSN